MNRRTVSMGSLLTLLAFAACATPGGGAGQKTSADEAPRLPEPDYLLPLARKVLHQRMERHGRDMPQLLFSVVLLQRDVAAETATRIANEPRIPRAPPGDDSVLNRALPERFFVLQADLRERAKALSDAAKNKDDKALARAFSLLTETCVACHSAYLNP